MLNRTCKVQGNSKPKLIMNMLQSQVVLKYQVIQLANFKTAWLQPSIVLDSELLHGLD